MNEVFAILAPVGIVFFTIYIVAKVFKLNLTPKNDYWTGFFDGFIIGGDD